MGNFKESYLVSVLSNKCPRCRKGNIYASKSAYKFGQIVLMNRECPVCNQPTEIEVGFYYGTGYVSYALSVGFSVATLIAWWFTIGFSLDDNRFFWWMGINAVVMLAIQPLFMRLSRTLWLSWFVSYDPEWEEHPIETPERVIPGQENNW
jgi:ribosomal protein S27AE